MNDDRFNHPERWTWCGERVLNIWPHPDGNNVSLTFENSETGNVQCVVLPLTYHQLTYTPPDPWEWVALPEVDVWTDSAGFVRIDYYGNGGYPQNLPRRRHRFFPAENSDA